ncbi:FimB/Mfa2 family fimbrial subunit [Prevotella sp. 10(H)]|uniref:FimB/Mfa2 family fimbrial subunit n=1 Tax=Prevotella sp. 10(H) TaxID=1158294 RepID=UPI0004A6E381|nr:FimB/Mfa2 family fimbrial subunit [Prevotella sp. 10(H)]
MINYIIKGFFLLAISPCLFCSCIRDGIDECPDYGCRIKVVLEALAEIPFAEDTDIKIIDLYIFDTDGYLIGKVNNVRFNEWVNINYKESGKLQIVAIANATNEDVILSEIPNNCTMAETALLLRPSLEFNSNLLYNAPGEIFYGSVTVNNNPLVAEERELPIHPIVSKINIKLKGHRHYTMQLLDLSELPADEDFTFVIQTRHLSVDFQGNPCNSPVSYHGKNILSYQGICEIPTFNMLSTDEGEEVAIYVYHKETLVDVVSETTLATRNSDKAPLTVYNGKLLEVYINYQSGITVSLQNTNWKEGGLMWKDF